MKSKNPPTEKELIAKDLIPLLDASGAPLRVLLERIASVLSPAWEKLTAILPGRKTPDDPLGIERKAVEGVLRACKVIAASRKAAESVPSIAQRADKLADETREIAESVLMFAPTGIASMETLSRTRTRCLRMIEAALHPDLLDDLLIVAGIGIRTARIEGRLENALVAECRDDVAAFLDRLSAAREGCVLLHKDLRAKFSEKGTLLVEGGLTPRTRAEAAKARCLRTIDAVRP